MLPVTIKPRKEERKSRGGDELLCVVVNACDVIYGDDWIRRAPWLWYEGVV